MRNHQDTNSVKKKGEILFIVQCGCRFEAGFSKLICRDLDWRQLVSMPVKESTGKELRRASQV